MSVKSKTKKSNEKRKLTQKEIILIILASVLGIALIVSIGFLVNNHFKGDEVIVPRSHALDAEPPYSDGKEVFDENNFKIANKGALDTEAFMTQIKGMDEARTTYQLIIQEKNSNEFFEMNYWVEEKGIYEYIFGGYDMGFDLEGHYYRTVMDGIGTIIDYNAGKYITETTDAEFHRKYYNDIQDSLTIDNILNDVLEGDFKTEMGTTADGSKVMCSENVSIRLDADGANPVLMILDKRGDTPVGYYVCYGMIYAMPNISDSN